MNFASLNNPFPLTQIFALPYVFDSLARMRRAADSAIGKAVLQGFEQRDLIGLAIYDSGSRSFYNVRRPIVEPPDLHGLKIRMPPSDIFIDLTRALGANPTPLPYGEVYPALQTHLIEGAENNWRTFHTSRQFEVARYWSQSDHSYSPEALLLSRRTFESLSAADRELMLRVAQESVPYMRTLWDRMEEESRTHVIAAGVRANRHFGFFLLVEHASPGARRVLLVIPKLIALAVGLMLAGWGGEMMIDAWDFPMAGAPLPQGVVFLPMCLGGLLIALFALEQLVSPPPPVVSGE